MYRRQLEQLRDRRAGEEKKLAAARQKEAERRASATKARAAAASTKSEATARSRNRDAARFEDEANRAARDSAASQQKIAGYVKEEARISAQVSRAERSEADAARRANERDVEAVRRRDSARQREVETRLAAAEARIDEFPVPQREKLRILLLSASAEGDLRVDRELKRIQAAVRSAYGRDLVELDVRMAATPSDLLDGLTQFRPHVVHFSGHSGEDLIVFDADQDDFNDGVVVSDRALARALGAVDHPPRLVVLNSCASARQAARLVDGTATFAIGMSESIDDLDAISFAARFYAALVDGQSIAAAHRMARAQLELDGATNADLPLLFEAAGFNADDLVLVVRD
jgi:hypothetical protein